MSRLDALTTAQREAVTGLERSTCVTSGAGCGKTRVLVERYIHHLQEDRALPLERLAAITFTENAAAQMRDRIRQACRDQIAQARAAGDARGLALWQARYWDVDVAPINTIHGFCSALLRRWPIEAGVDPGFEVLDETEAALLAEQTAGATLERLLEADDEAVALVLEHFQLGELLAALTEIVRDKRELLHRVAAPAMARSDDEILAALRKAVDERLRALLRETFAQPQVVEAVGAIERLGGRAGDRREQMRAAVAAQIEKYRRARTADIAAEAVAWMAGNIDLRGGSARNWRSQEDSDAVKEALTALRDAARDASGRLPPFDEDVERQHLALVRAFHRTASAAVEAYEEAKRRPSALDRQGQALDFEDLQIRVRDLLRSQPRVLDALRRHYRAVLVDELQDTNFLQFEIVDLLTSGPGRRGRTPLRPGAFFGVGDPKQSIYRFRGAQVEVFEEAERRVGPAGRKVLPESWRLHPGTAALVNHIFPPLMGEMYEPVEGKRSQVNDAVAETLIVVNPGAPDGGAFRSEEGHAEEARALAARLQEIVEGRQVQVWDDGAKAARPARYGDVAILLRRMSHLHLYEEALERQGVPYYVVAGGGFYKQQEVLDVLHLLRVLDDPSDDLHLAGVLRSPFFAVSDEGLYRLRKLGPTLMEAVPRAADAAAIDAEDQRGLARAARLLPQWIAMKDRLGLAQLVDGAVFDSGYAASAVGRFGGARAYANLRQMGELARHFEGAGLYALGDYIDYITDFLRSEMRQEQASIEAPGGETVQLMTIHKAKGLEFPVVVLPDLAHAVQPPRQRFFIHGPTGLALRLRDAQGDALAPSALALAREEVREAERRESHRLFYVAITRAKDYIIFASHRPGDQRRGETWLDVLLAGLGAGLEEGERDPVLPGGHRVRLAVGPPRPDVARRQRRRVGPREVFQRGRVDWQELAARAQAAGERPVREMLEACAPPPQGAPLPERLAATALDEYRRCPRLYWWRHVVGLDAPGPAKGAAEDGLTPSERGLIYHRAMELSASPAEADVRAAVEGALRERPGVEKAARAALGRQVAAAVTAFWNSDLGRRVGNAKKVYRELPFVLNLHRTEIAGTIDLLFEGHEGVWELVDYKPAGPEPKGGPDAAEPYRLQLGVYALAASRWLGRPVGRCTTYFYKSGAEVGARVTPADLEETESQAQQVLANIAGGRFARVERRACAGCRFACMC